MAANNVIYSSRKNIRKYIRKNYKVPSEYYPLIEEVIYRRALLFRFDEKRILLDLERGAKWVETVWKKDFPKEYMNVYGLS